MGRHLLIITILLLISSPSIGQDTLITTGKILEVWLVTKNPNDTIKGKRSQGTEESLKLYSDKKELMHQLMIAYPDENKIDKLKRNDKTLRKMALTDITNSYLWGKLDEYDMLFKPGFEFVDDNNNWIYVKCTKGQLEQVTEIKNREEQIKLRFKLKYIGEFDFQRIKGYRLIGHELIQDK